MVPTGNTDPLANPLARVVRQENSTIYGRDPLKSFHDCPEKLTSAKSSFPELSGCPLAQFKYVTGSPLDHTQVPSTAWSLSPIQCRPMPLKKAFSAALLIATRWPPRDMAVVLATGQVAALVER